MRTFPLDVVLNCRMTLVQAVPGMDIVTFQGAKLGVSPSLNHLWFRFGLTRKYSLGMRYCIWFMKVSLFGKFGEA